MTKASKKLITEAERFEALAKDAALKMVHALDKPSDSHMDSLSAQSFRKLASSHCLRAETFRSAAAIVSNP